MTLFYFVRHGQTILNREHRFNGGSVDSPLTAEGVASAQSVGQLLKNTKFDEILTSSMPRAVKTTEIMLFQSEVNQVQDMVLDPRLREFKIGDWDGQIIADVHASKHDMQLYFHRPDLFDTDAIHAESYDHLLKRSDAVIQQTLHQVPDGKVLIVSHGLLFTFLLNQLEGHELGEARDNGMMKNAAVTILSLKPKEKAQILGFNVTPEMVATDPRLKNYFKS